MKKIIITEDLTGINPFDSEESPDIVGLIKSLNINFGVFGKKYPHGNASQLELIQNTLMEDNEIAAIVPLYVLFSEDKFDSISINQFEDPWNSGIGGFIVFSKEFLKNTLEFKRVSRKKKFSKKRTDNIILYAEFYIDQLNAFLRKELYTVVKEVDGSVVDEITGIHGQSMEEVICNAETFLLDNSERVYHFELESNVLNLQ